MDQSTRREIQRIAAETLRDAGLTEPPLSVELLLDHVQLHRDYYDLSDPGFLDRAKHKLRVHGRKLAEIVNKVRLKAVYSMKAAFASTTTSQRLSTLGHPAMKPVIVFSGGTSHFSLVIPPRALTLHIRPIWRTRQITPPVVSCSSVTDSLETHATFRRLSRVSSFSPNGTRHRSPPHFAAMSKRDRTSRWRCS